jgi:hypothetical protein
LPSTDWCACSRALIVDRFKVGYGGAVDVAAIGITQALQWLADQIRDNEWGSDLGLPEEVDTGRPRGEE